MAHVVLVTGVSRYLGGRFASILAADPDVDRVIGVDVVPPSHPIGGAEFVRADIRNPVIAKVITRAAVYGCSPRDPAMFTEDTGPKALPRSGWGKDSVEVEGYVRGFSRRRPDVEVATLRLANFIGPNVRTPMTDYFRLPV